MSNNQMPATPFGKPYLEELRTDSLHPDSLIGSGEDTQKVGDVADKAKASLAADGGDASGTLVTPTNGTNAVAQRDLAGTRHHLPAYGSVADGSTTGPALAAVAPQLDPLGKTTVNLPVNADFTLGYDQAQAKNAGLGIFISDAPKNTGTNKRRQAVNPSWGSPHMFRPTVLPRHLKNFHAACATGSATVLIMGDSIFNAGSNLANPQQNAWNRLVGRLKLDNPGVDIPDWNMTWGGQTWAGMASANNGASVPVFINGQDGTTSWLNICLAKKPDLVYLYSGGNDGYSLDPQNVDKVVKAFQAIGADVILCETYQPETGATTGNYYQETVQDGVHYVRRYVTTYAQAHDLGYLPFGRWVDMIRDGFDPDTIAMPDIVPAVGTAYPARYTTVPTSALTNSGADYTFPALKNMLGVSADSCTDFCIAIEHDGIVTGTTAWRVILSDAFSLGHDNSLWVFFNGTTIQFHATDGAGNETVYPATTVAVPRSKWQCIITARGGRVTFAMRLPYPNGWVSTYPPEQSEGLGYTRIFDAYVPRTGGPYTPVIAGLGSHGATFRVAAFGVADVTRADGGCLRYTPTTNSAAPYYDTTQIDGNPNAGGSSSYHLNNFGVCQYLWPVIDAQDWSAPTAQAMLDSLSVSGAANVGYLTTAKASPTTMDPAFNGAALAYNDNFAEIHVKGGAAAQGFRIVYRNDDGSWNGSIPLTIDNKGTVTVDKILDCGGALWLGRFAQSALPTANEGAGVWCNDINAPVFAIDGKWYPVMLGAALS